MAEPRTEFIDYDARPQPKTNHFCCKCQKDFKQGQAHRRVFCIEFPFAVHPDDVHMVPEGKGDWYEIGLDCARALGLEWTFPATEALNDGSVRSKTELSQEQLQALGKFHADHATRKRGEK
jgi:hypothetical protein